MSTWSGCPYNIGQPPSGDMAELIRQMAAMNQKLEDLWAHTMHKQSEDDHSVQGDAENLDPTDPIADDPFPRVLPPRHLPRGPRAPTLPNQRIGMHHGNCCWNLDPGVTTGLGRRSSDENRRAAVWRCATSPGRPARSRWPRFPAPVLRCLSQRG